MSHTAFLWSYLVNLADEDGKGFDVRVVCVNGEQALMLAREYVRSEYAPNGDLELIGVTREHGVDAVQPTKRRGRQ